MKKDSDLIGIAVIIIVISSIIIAIGMTISIPLIANIGFCSVLSAPIILIYNVLKNPTKR